MLKRKAISLHHVSADIARSHPHYICGYKGCTHHFASLSQASRSSHWNSTHAEDCFNDQKVEPWTDTPRTDAVEHFQAPQDGDRSYVDVLRYRFTGNANIPTSINVHGILPKEKTIKGQNQQWKQEISRIWTHTSYDSRTFMLPSAEVGCKTNICKTLHRVMEGEELAAMLQTCLSSCREVDEDLELEGSDIENIDDSDEGGAVALEEATVSQLLPQDKKAYNDFAASSISTKHQSDLDLQGRTAIDIACPNGGHAVFVCPCPTCEDIFRADLVAYKFYAHLEHPKHWEYFKSTGILCEFGCGRDFSDEWHRSMHYNSACCPEMAKFEIPITLTCSSKHINPGVRTVGCQFKEPRICSKLYGAMTH
jgi:hypothetical protein